MNMLVPRPIPRLRLAALACLATVGVSFPALAAPAAQTQPAKDQQVLWKLADFTWVKLVPREAGAPANEQPQALEPDVLTSRLGAIRLAQPGGEEPLFGKSELALLREPLRQAFAQAGPDQDLLLLSSNRRGGFFLNEPLALTARLFWQDGALQVIVHDARMSFMDAYLGGHVTPNFTFGSRTAAGALQLSCPGALARSADWLAIPGPAAQAKLSVPAGVPVAQAQLRVPAGDPVAQAQPAAGPAAVPATGAADDYALQEKRLRAIKHMRDENLISEAVYQKKQAEIMDGL